MIKKSKKHVVLLSMAMSLTVIMMLSGCGKGDKASTTTEAPTTISETESTTTDAASETEGESTAAESTAESEAALTTDEETAAAEAPATTSESPEGQEVTGSAENKESAEDITSAIQIGDRYEDVIPFQGVDEVIKFEHIGNETAGFEMDYDYERFTRKSTESGEVFTLTLFGVEEDDYYLEIKPSNEAADAVAASISDELSKNYDVYKDTYELARAGSCIRIEASIATDADDTLDDLQSVYIIPNGDGCFVATAHYSYDSSDFYGNLFAKMMNTFSVIEK
jgi:hypothetical protein